MVTESLKQSPFLQALGRKQTSYTPIWIMRQAGRYMSEYRSVRSRLSFLELCKTPQTAAEMTVLAVEKLGVDAGIIFADILLPLEPMGLGLHFEAGDGPVIDRPIASLADIQALPAVSPSESLNFVAESISIVVKEFNGRTPLLGFAGAPFTLASYAVEGGSSRNYEKTKKLMYSDSGAWQSLMDYLTDLTRRYLIMQVEAGASAVQIFDSWVGCLSPADYKRFVLPSMKSLVAAVKEHTPVIYFGTSTAGLLEDMTATGADVVGVDWRIDLDRAWDLIGHTTGIQGNLDPLVLQADRGEIKAQAQRILKQSKMRAGHVFNLGHGVLPNTPVENVKYLVELVHELSAR